MKIKRFISMLLCLAICFAAFFGYSSEDFLPSAEDALCDYVTIENGKVVAGNADLVESGLIVIGSPEADACPEDSSSAPLESSSREATVMPTAPAEGAVTPSAIAPDVPRPTIKATLSGPQNGLTCNTAANYEYTITTTINFKGPISVSGGANVTIKGNGEADGENDGIYRDFSGNLITVNGGTLTIRGVGTSGNRMILEGKNSTSMFGSGAYTNGGGALIRLISGTVNLSYVQMRRNHNNVSDGGGIYMTGGTLNVQNSLSCYGLTTGGLGGFIYASSGTINYTAGGYIYQNTAKRGGGFAITGTAEMTIGAASFYIGDSTSGGTASEYGGGIYVDGGTVNVTNAIFQHNKSNGRGGAIAVLSGTATIGSGVTMSSNTAAIDGGGVYAEGTGVINISGGTIKDNSAPQGGGAYASGGGKIKMTSGTITSNDNGSGVFLYNGGIFEMSGGEISSNTAGNYSGAGVAIYHNGAGTFTMSGGVIKNHSGGDRTHGVGQVGSGITEIKGGTIENNHATNGGGIYISGGSLSISGGTITANSAANGVGGGVYLDNGSLTMTDGTISGNTANWGGGILAKASAVSVSIGGGTISGNTANINGGGVMAESGTLSISGGTISGNSANGGKGGGVYTAVGTTISGSVVIKDNTAVEDGGGVYVYSGTTTISGGHIGAENEHNYAVNGGGLYVANNATINIEDGASIVYNRCKTSGAGVFVYGASVNLSMSGGDVSHNYNEQGNGGGFWVGTLNSCSITGGTVNHNTVYVGCGGGMFFNRPITGGANISGLYLEENSANHAGGGLYFGNYGGTLTATLTDVTLVKNHATASATTSVPTAGSGGGIAVRCEPVSDSNAKGNVTVTVTDCTLEGNTAMEFGGGIYVVNENAEYKPSITIKGTTTVGNSEETANTANSGGGGIYARSLVDANTSIGFLIEGQVSIGYNTSATSGGGVFLYNVASATINGASILHNRANGTSSSGGSGGGIALYKASLGMEGTTVSHNYAGYNGGGIVSNISTLTATNCIVGDDINGGNSSGNSGGGIYVTNSGVFTLTGGSVSKNEATGGNGGGVCLENIASKATISGTVFHLNTALFETPDDSVDSKGDYHLASISSTGNGGAIYVKGETSVVEISGAKIGDAVESGYSNQAINGGGIAVMRGATATVTNSAVAYNYALRTGGGLYVLGCGANDPKVTTTLNMIGGSVESNSAAGSTVYTGSFAAGAGISGLGSEMGGGGFYLRGLSNWENKTITVDIDGTAINSNIAYRGAAMYVHENANVTVSNNASFTKNNAGGLGGVLCYMRNNSTASFEDCSFTENTAGLRGGALYIQTGGVSIKDSTFTSNSAVNYGGAILLRDITNKSIVFEITNTDFIGNRANNGGAISTSDGATNSYNMTLNLTDCDFTDNHATANGGALLIGGKTTFSLTGGYLTGNSAGEDESVIAPIASNQGQKETAISGAGGAVAVFDGTFNYSLNSTNKGAIYGNIATLAGDDVFSSGSTNSKLNLPEVSTMDLTNFEYDRNKDPDWYEDYATGEASGLSPEISSSVRYRQSKNTTWAKLSEINTQGNYVAITVGVDIHLGELVITKSGESIDDDQVFLFSISGEAFYGGDYVFMTVSIKGAGSITIKDLPVGRYTIKEITTWSWRYGVTTIKVDGTTTEITDSGISLQVTPDSIDHSIEFVNSLENDKWLNGCSDPVKNVAGDTSAVYKPMVYDLPKRSKV